ncbi:undecaprenyl-diphosphatase [Clostridia bacterium]|nr:undecaprenyl-diphosphatase [Clostridia bacterium]
MKIDIIQAIFLGLVQGLTEFFPVSSSGHLVLFQDILGLGGTEEAAASLMTFDIFLHVGTLAAVFAVFWRDIWDLFRPPFNRLLMLIGACVPAAAVGFLLSDRVEEFFGNGTYLPFFFLLTAAILFIADTAAKRRQKQKKPESPVGIKHAALMGLAQAAAIFPGLSRSGTTISAGILSGAERGRAARFSFFLSVPVIAGSALVSVVKGGLSGAGGVGLTAIAAGMAAAAVSGFLALKLMLKVVSKNNYRWFALYMAAFPAPFSKNFNLYIVYQIFIVFESIF